MSCKWFNVCPLRYYEKKKIIDNSWQKKYCKSDQNYKKCKRYIMEENNIFHEDNMMPDGSFI